LSNKVYDAIVSQPSHPWTSGASHLYTREFFELAKSKLADDGIFIQWIGQGFVDVPLFGSLMGAMSEVFEYVHVYRPVPAALVFMASNEPIDLIKTAPRALAESPESFARFGIDRIEDLLASWSLDTDGVRELAAGNPQNTDDHNRLATTRLPPTRAQANRSLERVDPISPAAVAEVDAAAVIRRMATNGERPRALRAAAQLPKAEGLSARGWIAYDAGPRTRALALFKKAVETDPDNSSARAGLIQAGGSDLLAELAAPITEREQIIIDTRLALERNDWEALRGMDAGLAQFEKGDLLYGLATRARARWRIEIATPSRGREAVEMLDGLLTRQRTGDVYLDRARAGAVAGDQKLAWAALDHIATSRFNTPPNARLALAIARNLGPPPEGSNTLERLRATARRRR